MKGKHTQLRALHRISSRCLVALDCLLSIATAHFGLGLGLGPARLQTRLLALTTFGIQPRLHLAETALALSTGSGCGLSCLFCAELSSVSCRADSHCICIASPFSVTRPSPHDRPRIHSSSNAWERAFC